MFISQISLSADETNFIAGIFVQWKVCYFPRVVFYLTLTCYAIDKVVSAKLLLGKINKWKNNMFISQISLSADETNFIAGIFVQWKVRYLSLKSLLVLHSDNIKI
jgi:hypothetical protein